MHRQAVRDEAIAVPLRAHGPFFKCETSGSILSSGITIIVRSRAVRAFRCATCHPTGTRPLHCTEGGSGQVRSGQVESSMLPAALHCTVSWKKAQFPEAHTDPKKTPGKEPRLRYSLLRQGQNRHLPSLSLSPNEIGRPRDCPFVIRRLLLACRCRWPSSSPAWHYKRRASCPPPDTATQAKTRPCAPVPTRLDH